MQAIYKIININTGMFYIGSSVDVKKRIREHLNCLNKNKHINHKLQSSFNKHGSESFKTEIVRILPEWYKEHNRYRVEQVYLDSLDKNKVYNLCFIADGGGSDSKAIQIYLLNLNGSINEKFDSLQDCRRYIGGSQINKRGLNKSCILRGMYRIVTPEFYDNNIEEVLSWSKENCSEKLKRIKKENKDKRTIIVTKDKIEYEFKTLKSAGDFIRVSKERVRQILKENNDKKFNIKFKTI